MFTVGGLSAHICVAVYGLSRKDMSGTALITLPVPWFAVGVHQDVYSTGIG